MKKILLSLLLLIPFLATAEEQSAIKTLNYSINLSYKAYDVADIVSTSASINIPLSNYIGANIIVYGAKANTKYNDYELDTTLYGSAVSLFLRDSNIGKIGASFAYAKSDNEYTFSDDLNLSAYHTASFYGGESKQYNYSLYGSYYINYFTISVGMIHIVNKDNYFEEYNSWSAGGSYYLKENTRFDVSTSGMDSDKKYTVGVVHQPSFLNNSIELGIKYSNYDFANSYSFFVYYHFNTEVTLKDRDREYR